MTMRKPIILLSLLLMFFSSCRDDSFVDKFKRPDWLAGKVYTQLKTIPELTTFARCIELTGYDKILDVSGTYTVFAPSNDAFARFFQQHATYKKVEDIPMAELNNLVKYHIVQNPWSKSQLRSLDVNGWIDTLNIENNKPRGFKRETLLLEKDVKYGVKSENKFLSIVDTLASPWDRKAATDSRKYVPIFFKEYFDIYDLNSSDYEFYFQRPFEGANDIYYAGAKIIGNELFAENGFVYVIDRVVQPLDNAYEILNKTGNNSYSIYLDLLNAFPEFVYNETKTFDQPGAEQGLKVDSLFDLSYPELTFNINRERTKAPVGTVGLPSNVTIRFHHGLMAPTNAAFQQFINEYISGSANWGSLKETPRHIKRIIAKTYMCANPIYQTNIENGFLNGEADKVKLEKSTIVQKQFGSNCSFIGLNKAVVPRAFLSVTGPVYQQRGYSTAMYAIESAGLLPALKRENEHYLFFIESEANLKKDSSLFYDPVTFQFTAYQISGSSAQKFGFTKNDLRTLLLNHIGTAIPKGIARKEFIRNLGGNYLIIDNQKGEVTGTAPTTIGYNGAIPATDKKPKLISVNADNGLTYEINNWFSFTSSDIYSKITTNFPKFHKLLVQAGLAIEKEYRYSFLSESEFYTIFAPSDAAIDQYSTSSMTKEQLQRFLMLHFIQGHILFTDGNKSEGYYETTRVDEKSTQFTTLYTQVYVKPAPDVIQIPAKTGGNYLAIPESPLTNIIVSRTLGTGTEAVKNIVSNAVIHQIDKVLIYDQINTK